MKTPRILILSAQSHSFIMALLSQAGMNRLPPVEVVSIREGETIELGEGDVYIVDTAMPVLAVEEPKVLTASSFGLERQLPLEPTDCQQGAAFYCGLHKYRRRKDHHKHKRKK
jgi:hypothetical protein